MSGNEINQNELARQVLNDWATIENEGAINSLLERKTGAAAINFISFINNHS